MNGDRAAILIVDDEQATRRALERTLMPLGVTMESIASGQEALERLATRPFAVVIVDYGMPGMNGLDLLQQIKERHPHIRRIMLTGATGAAIALRAFEEHLLERYITKPWDSDRLRKLVDAQVNEWRAENGVGSEEGNP